MTLAALVAALVALFEPIAQQWLAELFDKLKVKLAGQSAADEPAVAIHDVFAAARAELGWWSRLWGRAAVLDVYQRIALSRASQLATAARTGLGWNLLVPTGAEKEQLNDA